MTEPRLELVAAVAANGVIGRNGKLPWYLPDDLRHFKTLTIGHPVIMGRRTFESIAQLLPGRKSIVVSRTLRRAPASGLEFALSLEQALQLAAPSPGPAFVIGGALLYSDALPRVRVMHLTELDEPIQGDTFFPTVEKADWRLAGEVRHPRDVRHPLGFRFCTYERRESERPARG